MHAHFNFLTSTVPAFWVFPYTSHLPYAIWTTTSTSAILTVIFFHYPPLCYLSISTLHICDNAFSVTGIGKTSCGWSFRKTTQPSMCWSPEAVCVICTILILAEHSFREVMLERN